MKSFVVSTVFALALAGAAQAQVPDVYMGYENVVSQQCEFYSMDHALAEHSGHRLTVVQGNSRKDRRGGGFSTQEFQLGPGYLVLEREVLFQEDFRTVKRIGRI